MIIPGKKLVFAAFIAFFALLTPQLAAAPLPEKAGKKFFEKVTALVNAQKYKEAEALLAGPLSKNSPEAHYYMGVIQTRLKDPKKALYHFQKGAELNEINSIFKLACIHSMGWGTPKDMPKAFALFKIVAERSGYPEAYFQMGRMLLIGEGLPADQTAAVKYLKAAAEPDSEANTPHPNAPYLLGTFYKEQAPKTADAAKQKELWNSAFYYLELAAERNVGGAWLTLGNMYYFGNGISEADKERAVLCYKAAAAHEEQIAKACSNIAAVALEKGDADEALKWMKLAAERGNAAAQRFVREDYARYKKKNAGKTPEKKVKKRNHSVFRKAAELHMQRLLDKAGLNEKEPKEEAQEAPLSFLTAPLEAGLRMKEWTFDSAGFMKELETRLTLSRDGFCCYQDDAFLTAPLEKNLLPPNPTIRLLGYRTEEAVTKFLTAKKYPFFSDKESDGFYKRWGLAENLKYAHTNKLWQLRKGVYFNIFCDLTGAWKVRDYSFFITDDEGNALMRFSFESAPGPEEAGLIEGLLRQNGDALNNIAVAAMQNELECDMTVDGKWSGEEATVVTLFKQGCRSGSAVAALNLAQICTRVGEKEKALQYFKIYKDLKQKGK